MVLKMETRECSICKKIRVEHGNNAQPVNEGICCKECNEEIVLPQRIHNMKWGQNMREVLN